MTTQLAQQLYKLMRSNARRTSLEDLKQDGRRTVAVVNFREVQELIALAVEKTLQRRGLSLEHGGIHEDVRHEFLSLMRERDTLQDTVDAMLHERRELQRNQSILRHELDKVVAEYESIRSGPQARGREQADEVQQVVASLREALQRTLGAAGVKRPAIERTIGLVTSAMGEHQDLLTRHEKTAHELRLGQLQRRMGKLRRKLQETEVMLARARAEPGGQGIEGERVVPGVPGDDPDSKTKKELLSEIFRLNLELRQMLNRG